MSLNSAIDIGQEFERIVGAETWQRVDEACPEIHEDAWQRTANLLGSLAVGPEIRMETIQALDSSSTMMISAQRAKYDPESRSQVKLNTKKEVIERLYKAGRVSKTKLRYVPGVGIVQDGRALTEITANSHRFSPLEGEMKLRATYEQKNAEVFNQLALEGVLDTHDALVVSLASRNKKVIKDYGVSEKYMTGSFQLMSKSGNDIKLDTALVAGKKTEFSECHDIDAIKQLAKYHGVPIDFDDPADLLDVVILVPKGELPNGVIDFVKQFDDFAGGTFFGQALPRQNYVSYAETQQNQNFDDIVDKISSQLIKEAHLFAHPMQAIRRLGELADYHTVVYAVDNRAIDVAIFGMESALLIAQAREASATGDTSKAERLINKAHEKSTNSSCPVLKEGEKPGEDSGDGGEEKSEKKWMNCPHCKAKVFDDPCAKVLSCWDCKAMVVNGSVISKGNGGSRKRKEKARERVLSAQKKGEENARNRQLVTAK